MGSRGDSATTSRARGRRPPPLRRTDSDTRGIHLSTFGHFPSATRVWCTTWRCPCRPSMPGIGGRERGADRVHQICSMCSAPSSPASHAPPHDLDASHSTSRRRTACRECGLGTASHPRLPKPRASPCFFSERAAASAAARRQWSPRTPPETRWLRVRPAIKTVASQCLGADISSSSCRPSCLGTSYIKTARAGKVGCKKGKGWDSDFKH